MQRRSTPAEFLPAVLLAGATLAALGYLQLAPVAGEPVAALFSPGLTGADALARLAAEWRVLGIESIGPVPVLLLRSSAGVGQAPVRPTGAWLLLRASGAGQCAAP